MSLLAYVVVPGAFPWDALLMAIFVILDCGSCGACCRVWPPKWPRVSDALGQSSKVADGDWTQAVSELQEPPGMDSAVLLHLLEGAPQVPKVVRGVEVPKAVLEMEGVIPIPDHTRALALSEEPKDCLLYTSPSPRD